MTAADNSKARHSQLALMPLMLGLVVVGTANQVMSKVRSVPLAKYNYFTAVLNSGVYALVWCTVVVVRIWLGHTDLASVRYVYSARSGAWRLLALCGLGDVAGNVLGFIGQPYLTLPMYSLANQGTLVFSVIFSMTLLHTRYILLELLAVILVIAGMIILVVSTCHGSDGGLNVLSFLVVVASTCGNAASFVLKEKVFRGFQEFLDGQRVVSSSGVVASNTRLVELAHSNWSTTNESGQAAAAAHPAKKCDTFVVSSCTNLFGALFVLPMLPVNIILKQTDGKTLVEFFEDGVTCLGNVIPARDPFREGACTFAWQAWFLYIVVNLFLNLLILLNVKHGSALLTFVSMKAVTPCSLMASLVAWHVGPITLPASQAGPAGWICLVLVLIGVCFFRYGNIVRDRLPDEKHKCCWPLRCTRP